MKNKKYVENIIIGAGAAGLMCGNILKQEKLDFIILESNKYPGVKLKITGNGRCNILNNKNSFDLIEHISSNPKFMLFSLNNFGSDKIINFFEQRKLYLKTEKDDRMYPKSENSQDVIDCLVKDIKPNILTNYKVNEIIKKDDLYMVNNGAETFVCKNLIIATGGQSYPLTGSDGFGYKVAKQFGHKLVPLFPVGVALNLDWDSQFLNLLSGVAVSNAKISYKKKTIAGDVLFTHFGLSGPGILRMSHFLKYKNDEIKLDLTDCEVPKRLKNFLKENNIPLNNFVLKVKSHQGLNKAIVTRGGVSVKEIDPKTFESKINENLFFIGEVLDVDAHTGGYNLTLCWSMGATCAQQLKKRSI